MNFSNEGSNPLKCLFDDCAQLGALTMYESASYPKATPSTFGCWFPIVGSQSELNSSYSRITTANYDQYFFFKTVGSGAILYQASILATGFANGTAVPVLDEPDENITNSNIGQARLIVNNDDGPVILVGVLDIGLPDRRTV